MDHQFSLASKHCKRLVRNFRTTQRYEARLEFSSLCLFSRLTEILIQFLPFASFRKSVKNIKSKCQNFVTSIPPFGIQIFRHLPAQSVLAAINWDYLSYQSGCGCIWGWRLEYWKEFNGKYAKLSFTWWEGKIRIFPDLLLTIKKSLPSPAYSPLVAGKERIKILSPWSDWADFLLTHFLLITNINSISAKAPEAGGNSLGN